MDRNAISYLNNWKFSKNRKPLLIQGARQVGKTSLVRLWADSNFENLLELNLELHNHAQLFTEVKEAKQIFAEIELLLQKKVQPGKTLLFIDEIQAEGKALTQLRYFFEQTPNLHVIASGSLLEALLAKENVSVPVGRISFLQLHPLSFDEFLNATGNRVTREQLKDASLQGPSTEQHEIYIKKFLNYAYLGGMPEVIARFSENESFLGLSDIYEDLFSGFMKDISKYSTAAEAKYIRHCLLGTPASVGRQIAYRGFADSKFRSREISLAFDSLELAHLVRRIRSSRSIALPLVENPRKAPKLVFLDAGLVNHQLGLRKPFQSSAELENTYQGQLTEQLLGQALVACESTKPAALSYWYKDAPGSQTEVDYLIEQSGQLIPIEVKTGHSNHLRSLMSFIDESKQEFAVRVSSLPLGREPLRTSTGRNFQLLNVPHYLAWRIRELIDELG